MKKTLTVLLIFLTSLLSATPELSSMFFSSENVEMDVTYRYKNDISELYYSTLIKNLNSYAESLIKSGKLKKKKIYLAITIAEWMEHDTGIRMYRYKYGYFCYMNGLVQKISQDYLAKIILYFSSPNWQSFYYDEQKMSPRTAAQIFNKRLSPSTFHPSKLKAWENGNITVYLENDTLLCYNGNVKLGPLKWMTPFALKTRQFVLIGESIYIYEKGVEINKVRLNKEILSYYEGIWKEIHPKWVNFFQPGKCVLSYSYSRNKFYKL